MTEKVATIIGSGTLPYTRGILPATQRGNEPLGEGMRIGTQVVIANPEDIVAVDAFAVSGITVGASAAVELVGPNTSPLPRSRELHIINNTPATTLFVGPSSDLAELRLDGFVIQRGSAGAGDNPVSLVLPLLHNTSVWAAADAGDTINVRILIL